MYSTKNKCDYYEVLNEKGIVDNKQFWKTIKRLLSIIIITTTNIYTGLPIQNM